MLRSTRTEVGQHISFVSSFVTCGEAITCSVLQPPRNCEYGLFNECLWFFEASNRASEESFGRGGTEILARCSTVPPYFPRYSVSASPNNCAGKGVLFAPGYEFEFLFGGRCHGGDPMDSSDPEIEFSQNAQPGGLGQSDGVEHTTEPGAMHSNPRAAAHSAAPYFTILFDR